MNFCRLGKVITQLYTKRKNRFKLLTVLWKKLNQKLCEKKPVKNYVIRTLNIIFRYKIVTNYFSMSFKK